MAIKELKFADHEEWLNIRSQFIGGSDASACLGVNPYKSRYSLWAEKTGKIPGFEGSMTTEVGAYLEEFVAQKFEEQTRKKVRRKNFTLVNDDYPFACANLDRVVVGEKAFLEIKTTNSPVVCRQLKSDEFPEMYYCQCCHYLAVTGYEKCYLAVLSECRNFKVYEMSRDEVELSALMDAERDFWELVQTNTEPNVDGTESTTEAIKKLYPNAEDKSVDLLGYEDKVEAIVSLNAQIKELSTLKDSYANDIKTYMKDAGNGILEGYSITFKNQSKSVLDEEALKKAYPNIDLDAFKKESVSRVFRCSAKKGKKK